MSDPGDIDDLVLLSGCLGRITVAGRRFEVAEPCLRAWTGFARDVHHVTVSFLAGALTADAGRPTDALAFFAGPASRGFWDSARSAVAACLRSERTGRVPTPEWVGRHARPRDMVAVLRVVADRTTTGDTLGRTVRAFLGLPPRDEGAVAAGWGMANTFDLLASEYGWSLDQILDLSLTQIRRISDAIAARYRRQNPDSGDGESGREHDEHGRRRKVEPIDLGDPTWQITRVDPHGGPWDSVSPAVAEKFKAAGYVSMMDFHEKGRAKLERVEAEAGAGRR